MLALNYSKRFFIAGKRVTKFTQINTFFAKSQLINMSQFKEAKNQDEVFRIVKDKVASAAMQDISYTAYELSLIPGISSMESAQLLRKELEEVFQKNLKEKKKVTLKNLLIAQNSFIKFKDFYNNKLAD